MIRNLGSGWNLWGWEKEGIKTLGNFKLGDKQKGEEPAKEAKGELSKKDRHSWRCASCITREWKAKVKVTQLCQTLCNPMDYTVHGILPARILEWVAFPFSRGSSQPREQTQVSHIAGRFSTSWEPQGKPNNIYKNVRRFQKRAGLADPHRGHEEKSHLELSIPRI